MGLPPLELFSLRRELSCCRAALSVLTAQLRPQARLSSCRWPIFRPRLPALLAAPGILRIHALRDCVIRPVPGTRAFTYSGSFSHGFSTISRGTGCAAMARLLQWVSLRQRMSAAPLPVSGSTIQSKERADVAQLVEQLIRNQQVVSSSLTVGSRSRSLQPLPCERLFRLWNPRSHTSAQAAKAG